MIKQMKDPNVDGLWIISNLAVVNKKEAHNEDLKKMNIKMKLFS